MRPATSRTDSTRSRISHQSPMRCRRRPTCRRRQVSPTADNSCFFQSPLYRQQSFRALFSGTFAEGEIIRNAAGSPVEIRVSDAPSDPLLLCQLLHFQGDLDKVRPEQLLDLALIIDKYDCGTALRYAIISKLATLELDDIKQTEHVYYLTAAWILDQPNFFRDLSKEIVTHDENGPLGLNASCLDILPDKVLSKFVLFLHLRSLDPRSACLRRPGAYIPPQQVHRQIPHRCFHAQRPSLFQRAHPNDAWLGFKS
jgi:hypothetical protein